MKRLEPERPQTRASLRPILTSLARTYVPQVRINYEEGIEASYWGVLGQAPSETAWRAVRVRTPPPARKEPVYDRLHALQTAVAEGRQAPPCHAPKVHIPVAWEGAAGGDARLHAIVPMLSTNGREPNHSAWPLVSTHVPGRSGRECRDRWQIIQHLDANSQWLATSATRAISHTQAAEALECANRAAALAAAANDEDSSDDDETSTRERCCISGCKRQLLSCSGQKRHGSAIGCAEEHHLLCAPCLYRWFASEKSLREAGGRHALTGRRTCPVCKSELRAAGSAIRANADSYVMGLLKVEGTW